MSDVVRALRILSHSGHDGPEPADLNELLEAAILVIRHAIDDVAVLHLDLGDLPPVRCDVAGLAEAVLVLLLDAVEVLEHMHGRSSITTVRTAPARNRGGSIALGLPTGR